MRKPTKKHQLKRRSKSREVLESKVRLVNGFSLVALTLVSVVALWLVSPSRTMLLSLLAESSSPDVALAFLYALDESVQDDRDIKYLMFKNHLILNNLKKAEAIILPLLYDIDGKRNWEAFQKYLKLMLAQYASAKTEEDKQEKYLALKRLFDKTDSIPNADIARFFADSALEMGLVKKAYQYLLPHSENRNITGHSELLSLALQFSYYQGAILHQEKIYASSPNIDKLTYLLDLYKAANKNREGFHSIKSQYENKSNDKYRSHLIKTSEFKLLLANLAMEHDDKKLLDDLVIQLLSKPLSELFLTRMINSSMAYSLLDIAMLFSEKRVERYPSQKNIKEAHDIAIWNGDILRALQLTKLRVVNNPSQTNIRQAIKESIALGDYASQGDYYRLLEEKGFLKNSEFESYLNIIELTEGTKPALGIVNVFLGKSSERRFDDKFVYSLLLHKARLKSYLSQYDQLGLIWEKIVTLTNENNAQLVTIDDAQLFAEANIKLGQPRAALQALTQIDSWIETPTEVLRKIFALAWKVGDKAIAIQVLDALNSRPDYDALSQLNGYRYVQLHQPFTEHDIPTLLKLSEQWQNEQLLIIAIDLAFQNDNYELLDQLLAKSMKNPDYANDERLIYYAALSAIRQGDDDKVKQLFSQLLAKQPKDDSIIGSYLWWLIDHNEIELLNEVYSRYQFELKDKMDFWLVFSSASQKLGRFNDAEYWLKKLLLQKNDVSVNAILDYAQLMEQKGKNDTAFRLRRYAVNNLSEALFELEPERYSFSSMLRIFSGERFSLPLVEQQVINNPTKRGTIDLFSYYLQRKDYQKLQFLNQEKYLGHFELPDWQKLSLALLEKDEQQVKDLISHSLQLPVAQKNYAMQRLGGSANIYQFDNWQHGESQLSTNKNEQTLKELRNVHINQHPSQSRGYAFDFTRFTHWGINRSSLKYYEPLQSGWWDLRLMQQRAKTPNIIFNSILDQEKRLTANVNLKVDWFESFFQQTHSDIFSIQLDVANGEGSQRDGLLFGLSMGIDDRLQTYYSLGINQAFEQSQFATLVAKNDRIGFGFDYFLTSRESVSFRANINEITTRFDDFIASGWDYSFRFTEKLFASDPSWEIYLDFVHQENWFKDEELTNINQFYSPSNEINARTFVDKIFAKLSIGQRFSHGAPGLPGALKPSPTYWLDTSFGVNPINNQKDVTISSGVGFRIFGDDELSIKFDWQSRDINGDEALTFSLGYYYNL